MNKSDIIKSRLLFEIARKKAEQEIKPENLVVKTTANSARKCESARHDFAYERGMIEVAINKDLLKKHGKTSSKLLMKSINNVVARQKMKSDTLSA